MGHFEFGLESVLQLRKILKDIEISLLEEAFTKLYRLQASLDDCLDRIKQLEAELADERSAEDIDIQTIIQKYAFLLHLRREEDKLRAAIRDQEKAIAQRQAAVIERSKDQKIMEKLKERDYSSYLRNERRRADKVVDELVLMIKQKSSSRL